MLKALTYIPLIFSAFNPLTTGEQSALLSETKYLINTATEIILDIEFVHQINDLKETKYSWTGGSACGPAAIAMALNANETNYKYTLEEVLDVLPNSVYVKGDKFYNILAGPSSFGYESNTIDIDPTAIYETLKQGHPVLMNIQNYDGITGHEVVVVGIKNYDSAENTATSLIVHDPFRAPYREFKYLNNNVLVQPEGWYTRIGTVKPFFITKSRILALSVVK